MQTEQQLTFGPYRLDLGTEQMWCRHEEIPLPGQVFALLRYLVEHAGQLVSKAELFAALWPEIAVTDGALTFCIVALRKALGDNAKAPQFIETVHRRGYRFIGHVIREPSAVGSRNEEQPQPTLRLPAPSSQPLVLPDKPSIVVLPFTNLTSDPTQEYFSDGITEEITATLSRIASLFVIARTSAFAYKGKGIKVQDISRDLGVRYVLEGSVRKADDHLRIIAQLIDATTGGHLWAEHYHHPFADIFAVQDEIVQKIVTTLKLQLTVQERGYLERKSTGNLEAYDTFLRGVERFSRTTQEANGQARRMFEQAVALDPQYAQAYAWLGTTYLLDWLWRWNADPQTLERAVALAHQALVLDDSLPGAHSLLSQLHAQRQQYDQAIAEGARALVLDPNNDFSCNRQGVVLTFAGRPAEALPLLEQARRLNPHYPPFYVADLGWAYNVSGRHAEAIAALQEATRRAPTLMAYYAILANSYVHQWAAQQETEVHTLEEARAAAQRSLALNDAYPVGHVNLGAVHLWQKQYAPAVAELERAIELDPSFAGGYGLLAETLGRMSQREEAIQMAEQALPRKPPFKDGHLNSVGTAYYFAGKPEEALAPLRQYLSRYPNMLSAHLILAAVYSEVGNAAEAHAEAAEVLRITPTFSIDVHKERVPITDRAMVEWHMAALRKAGLK